MQCVVSVGDSDAVPVVCGEGGVVEKVVGVLGHGFAFVGDGVPRCGVWLFFVSMLFFVSIVPVWCAPVEFLG